jgi:predicted Kef-type K+ transport protein
MELLWIAVAFACGLIARNLRLPALVGYLAAGFALNYAGFGHSDLLEYIAHTGVLLLLFSVGLKLRIKNILRAEVFAGSLLHIALTSAVLFAVFLAINGLQTSTALIVCIALSFSSTVVAAKVLEEKKELRSFHGRVSIGILIIQDLVAVVILSLSSGHSPSIWGLSLLALPLLKPVVHRLLEWSGHDELLVLFGLVLALVIGGLGFESFGLSSELGALLLGILLADHRRSSELSHALWSLKEVFLVGFFLQIGMSGLPNANSLIYAIGLLALLPVKSLLYFFVLLLFRLRARTAFLAALSLTTYSEFGLIIAQLGVQNGWFASQWLVTMAFAVALSFVLAAPLNRIAHGLYSRFEQQLTQLESKRRHPDDEPIHLGSAQMLIVGMGRVGAGAYNFLSHRDLRCVGLDSDPAQVERHLKAGRRVLYADAEDPGLWHNLHVQNITAVLLAMPDLEANVIAVTQLRKAGYKGFIGATGVYPEHVDAIVKAGADVAYNYYDEVGVGFAEEVWEKLYP